MSTSQRGFASMSLEKRRAIASKGGKNSPANFANLSKEVLKEYGRRGGKKSRGGGRKPKSVV